MVVQVASSRNTGESYSFQGPWVPWMLLHVLLKQLLREQEGQWWAARGGERPRVITLLCWKKKFEQDLNPNILMVAGKDDIEENVPVLSSPFWEYFKRNEMGNQ